MTALTTEQARALRNADSICYDTDRSGEGQIRAIHRGTNDRGEITYTIPVASASVQNYGSGGEHGYDCFAMTMHAPHSRIHRTWLRRVKAGTTLHLRWTRNNSSPVTEQAGIVVDYLDLIVANGTVSDTFRVETFIGLDNSARMVRLAPA